MRVSSRLLFPLSLAASAHAAHYEVTVGKGGQLKFEPETLKAEVGDTIQYHFYAKNHSVVQSSFAEPCQPLKDGFFSAFVPTASPDTPSRTSFTITLSDKNPKWIYCSQGDHCKKGMVHAINAPETGNTLAAYKDAAAGVTASQSPPNVPVGGVRQTTVDVGKNGLTFEPNNINEPKGTVVSFMFHPKNHSVVQSSFDKPCLPLSGGFSSGSVPVTVSPSGVEFAYTIDRDTPIWFYCGQTTGNHCQSGMVGAINAPTEGNTLDAFILKAKAVPPPSVIPPASPLGGVLAINGTTVSVLPSQSTSPPSTTTTSPASQNPLLPPPAQQTLPPISSPSLPPYWSTLAGGPPPSHFAWTPTLSNSTIALLQASLRLDDLLLRLLWQAFKAFSPGGNWAGMYPPAMIKTVGAWAGQAAVHRASTAQVLGHYNASLPGGEEGGGCKVKGSVVEEAGVEGFVRALAGVNAAFLSALVDGVGTVREGFVVGLVVAQVGALGRVAGVVNMMQDHMASARVREVGVPAGLAWSYVAGRWAEGCEEEAGKVWPVLTVAGKEVEGGVVKKVELAYEGGSGEVFVAWLGPYGLLEFTQVVTEAGGKKAAAVPDAWYGDVWIAVVSKNGLALDELADHMVAGPERVWITEPW